MNISPTRHAYSAFKPAAIAFAISAVFPTLVFSQTVKDQNLDPVVVTASRTVQKISEVLSDTIVISAEEIAQSGQTSLIDLLHTKRGIEVARNGGAGNTASVFMRGGNSNQTVLLIDGVRSFSSTSGAPIWSAVPLSQIERVEIVLGPLSTLYGADAVGGVIQVFTKKGAGAPHFAFSAGAGTYGEQVVTAGVSGATGDTNPFRYSINVSTEKADGFSSTLPTAVFAYNADKDGYEKQSVNGQFSWEVAKGQELGFTFLNSRNDAQFDSGPGHDSRDFSDVNLYSFYTRNQMTSNWNSLLQVSRSYSNNSIVASYGDSKYDSLQESISWQNDLKFGLNFVQLIAEHRKEEVSSTDLELNRERTTDSFAANYQRKQGAHLFSAGVRYDDNSDYGDQTTSNVGYGFSINEALRLAASYGTSFRAPTYNELFYPGYGVPTNSPEKGKNAEVGMHFDNGNSRFSAIYYRNRITDLLITSSTCPPGYTFGCASNVDEALLTGFSFSAGTKLGTNVRLKGTLDLQDPRDETSDKLLARRSKVHGTVGIDYSSGKVIAGADVFFSDYRFDDSANTAAKRLPGYALLNLHSSYDLGKDWQVFGRWNNVFDRFYEQAYGYQTPGSNLFVGVRYGFN